MHPGDAEDSDFLGKKTKAMKTTYDCMPCFVRQTSEALALAITDDDTAREKALRTIMAELAQAQWEGSPPQIAQKIYRRIKSLSGNEDPYAGIKKKMNAMASSLMPRLRKVLASSDNPHRDVLKIVIAGNLLDSGAKTMVAPEHLPEKLDDLLGMPLNGDPELLFAAAAKADSILYLADNAGEIFFDRLLIEMLPKGKVTVAVRGQPAINDATLEDAREAGLDKIATLIDNGSDAPGTVLEECSETFQAAFRNAALIISKGQGNYETLSEHRKGISFLLSVKCQAVANDIGAPIGSMVVENRI